MGTVDVLTQFENEHIGERQALPKRYLGLSVEEMDRRIAAARATLGKRLVVLGHHYQRDEVIKFADYTGDSWKLSKRISQHQDAEFIIFCGVHFMAESADILAAPHQQVILPDLAAGCSMADMAEPEQLEMAWKDLEAVGVASTATSAATSHTSSSPVVQPCQRGGMRAKKLAVSAHVGSSKKTRSLSSRGSSSMQTACRADTCGRLTQIRPFRRRALQQRPRSASRRSGGKERP